jgi:glutaredoxin
MYCHVSRLTAFLFFIVGVLSTSTALAGAVSAAPGSTQPDIEVFSREGCPHCEDAKQFLDVLRRERPDLKIVIYDIWKDPSALERLRTLAATLGAGTPGVPAFYVRGELIIGYAGPDITGARLKALLAQPRAAPPEQGWLRPKR